MLIVNASAPKGPEIAMQRHLKPMAGVLIGNGEVPRSNGMTRETDGIVLTPSRVFVVEAKGFIGDTPNSGLLDPALNGDWTIGGQVAKFYGGEWPNVQARQSAQTLAGVLREQTTVKAFVTGIASISAKNAVMPGGPVQLGEVMVCKDHDLLNAVAAMPMLGRNKPITVDHVFEVLKALRLPERMWPKRADVEAEWVKASQQTQTTPSTASAASGDRVEEARGDERTFKQIMADAKARNGGKTPRQVSDEVLHRLGVTPDAHTYRHPPLPAPSTEQPDPSVGAARMEEKERRGRAVLLVVGLLAVLWAGKTFVGPDASDMEDSFKAALSQAYPEAEATLDVSTLACVDHEHLDVTTFYCGVLTRDSGEQRWRYEANASEPKFLTADDVSREINDLGASTLPAERAETEALSQIRTAFPAKAKKVTREYVECKQGEDDGTWPFKNDSFDCFGFDGPARQQRYRYEVSITGDDPTDFKAGTVYRNRENA